MAHIRTGEVLLVLPPLISPSEPSGAADLPSGGRTAPARRTLMVEPVELTGNCYL